MFNINKKVLTEDEKLEVAEQRAEKLQVVKGKIRVIGSYVLAGLGGAALAVVAVIAYGTMNSDGDEQDEDTDCEETEE